MKILILLSVMVCLVGCKKDSESKAAPPVQTTQENPKPAPNVSEQKSTPQKEITPQDPTPPPAADSIPQESQPSAFEMARYKSHFALDYRYTYNSDKFDYETKGTATNQYYKMGMSQIAKRICEDNLVKEEFREAKRAYDGPYPRVTIGADFKCASPTVKGRLFIMGQETEINRAEYVDLSWTPVLYFKGWRAQMGVLAAVTLRRGPRTWFVYPVKIKGCDIVDEAGRDDLSHVSYFDRPRKIYCKKSDGSVEHLGRLTPHNLIHNFINKENKELDWRVRVPTFSFIDIRGDTGFFVDLNKWEAEVVPGAISVLQTPASFSQASEKYPLPCELDIGRTCFTAPGRDPDLDRYYHPDKKYGGYLSSQDLIALAHKVLK